MEDWDVATVERARRLLKADDERLAAMRELEREQEKVREQRILIQNQCLHPVENLYEYGYGFICGLCEKQLDQEDFDRRHKGK